MRILQLMSCRGWSSDAYWAARMTRELERRGHAVTLACLAGTDARVIDGVRREGVEPVTSLALASGVRPVADSRDLGRLRAMLESADVVHVHRGKEHWLAAVVTGGVQLFVLTAISGEFSGFRVQAVSWNAWFALVYLIIAGSIVGRPRSS